MVSLYKRSRRRNLRADRLCEASGTMTAELGAAVLSASGHVGDPASSRRSRRGSRSKLSRRHVSVSRPSASPEFIQRALDKIGRYAIPQLIRRRLRGLKLFDHLVRNRAISLAVRIGESYPAKRWASKGWRHTS